MVHTIPERFNIHDVKTRKKTPHTLDIEVSFNWYNMLNCYTAIQLSSKIFGIEYRTKGLKK